MTLLNTNPAELEVAKPQMTPAQSTQLSRTVKSTSTPRGDPVVQATRKEERKGHQSPH